MCFRFAALSEPARANVVQVKAVITLILLASPDRSGEADFLKMLEGCSKLQNVEIVMNKCVRDRDRDALQSDANWLIRLAKPNVFRIYVGHYWNSDIPVYTRDRQTLMISDSRAVLQNAPKNIVDIQGAFAPGAPYYSPLFDFMRGGEAALLAVADSDIVKTASGFRMTSKLGAIEVTLTKHEGLTLPLIIDVSNLAGRLAAYRLFPMFSDRPEQPLERYVMDYKFGPQFPRGEFDTKPPKGLPVEDQRKKG